jgi:hypothetical protein
MTEAARAATQRVRLWALVGVVLLGAACGKVTRHPRHGTAQAGETSGGDDTGTDAGAGGARARGSTVENNAGGESEASRTRAAAQANACIAYALAVCRRRAVCNNGAPDNCLNNVTLECPDLVFSDGAKRSVEDLTTCAKAYETVPCEDLKHDVVPGCVTPGTRAQGEACAFPSQCQSLDCKMTGDCGACAVEAALGESCAAADVECDAYTACGASQTCIPLSGSLAFEGEACMPDHDCFSDYYCDGVCRPLPKLGDSCADAAACADGAYCGAGDVCFALPSSGKACGVQIGDDGQPTAADCGPGLTCSLDADAKSGTCLPPPELGEPCFFTAGLPSNYACKYPLHCNDAVSPTVCAAIAAPGEPCHDFWECEQGLMCACPPDAPSCEHKSCREARFDGEPCDEPNVACHPAFRCKGGVCLARGTQGIFASACGE